MARNPTWERDEVILALDLYLQFGRLDQTSPQVIELSHVLQQLPIHPVAVRQENFRNPAGVALKIENIRALCVCWLIRQSPLELSGTSC